MDGVACAGKLFCVMGGLGSTSEVFGRLQKARLDKTEVRRLLHGPPDDDVIEQTDVDDFARVRERLGCLLVRVARLGWYSGGVTVEKDDGVRGVDERGLQGRHERRHDG